MKDRKDTTIEENETKQFPDRRDDRPGLEKFIDYVKENNKKIITIISIIAIAVVALIFTLRTMEEGRLTEKNEASLALSRIVPYVKANDYQNALYADSVETVDNITPIGLIEITEKYKGTSEGDRAALYAGEAFIELGEYDKAEKYFQTAIDSDIQLVRMGGNAGMAVVNENKGNYSAASGHYEKASELAQDIPTKHKYLFYAALNYEETGDLDKASKLYREIILDNRSQNFEGESRAALARLGKSFE